MQVCPKRENSKKKEEEKYKTTISQNRLAVTVRKVVNRSVKQTTPNSESLSNQVYAFWDVPSL
jgi:hypothetical protein